MQYVDVPIEAELSGDIANVPTGVITGFSNLPGFPKGVISNVYNLSPTTGGKYWNVAIVGDIILVPKTTREVVSVVVTTRAGYGELFGVDIFLNDGEFTPGVEHEKDFARVAGTKNLIQALHNRIITTKRFYPYNSDYGTNLKLYIGKKGNMDWYDLIKVDIQEGVLRDVRIQGLKDFEMDIDGDMVELKFDAIPINEQSRLPINIVV